MALHIRPTLTKPSVPEEFITLSFAYLDSAENLNSLMSEESWPGSFQHGQVVLYLTCHATELFLTGCILSISLNTQVKGHSLARLAERLELLDHAIEFKPPFMVEAFSPDLIAKAEKDNTQPHERLRYPINNNGEPWPGLHAFDAKTFAPILRTLGEDFARIYQHVFKVP